MLRAMTIEWLRAMARYSALYPWYNLGLVDRARERADELVAYGRTHGELPAPFGGEDVLTLVMGFQGGLFPAVIAMRCKPLESLR